MGHFAYARAVSHTHESVPDDLQHILKHRFMTALLYEFENQLAITVLFSFEQVSFVELFCPTPEHRFTSALLFEFKKKNCYDSSLFC